MNNRGVARMAGIIAVIGLAAMLRLIPHAPNFSPIAAMALFGGAYLSQKRLAFLLPLAAMFVSDCVIGFHDQMMTVYVSFVLVTMVGMMIRSHRSIGRVGVSTVLGSLIFFVITNTAVWFSSGMYERSVNGLITCFVAALPFLQNNLAGDAFFATVLFGGWALIEKSVPALQDA
jgi:hypothetical protein